MPREIHEESWLYQEMLDKGIVQRSKLGSRRECVGAIQQESHPEEKAALQTVFTNLMSARCPAVLPLVQDLFNTSVDNATLKQILRKLFKAGKEEEVRQILSDGPSAHV